MYVCIWCYIAFFSKEKEIVGLQQSIEEGQTNVASLQRRIRELEAKIEELEEDLENERSLRKRVRQDRYGYKQIISCY